MVQHQNEIKGVRVVSLLSFSLPDITRSSSRINFLPLLGETILIARDCLLWKVSLFFFQGDHQTHSSSAVAFQPFSSIDSKEKYCFCEVSKICDVDGLKLNAPKPPDRKHIAFLTRATETFKISISRHKALRFVQGSPSPVNRYLPI